MKKFIEARPVVGFLVWILFFVLTGATATAAEKKEDVPIKIERTLVLPNQVLERRQ